MAILASARVKNSDKKATTFFCGGFTFADDAIFCKPLPTHMAEVPGARLTAAKNIAISGGGRVATGARLRAERDLIHVAMGGQMRRAISFFEQNIHKSHRIFWSQQRQKMMRKEVKRLQEVQGGPMVILAQANWRSTSVPVLVARVTSSMKPWTINCGV